MSDKFQPKPSLPANSKTEAIVKSAGSTIESPGISLEQLLAGLQVLKNYLEGIIVYLKSVAVDDIRAIELKNVGNQRVRDAVRQGDINSEVNNGIKVVFQMLDSAQEQIRTNPHLFGNLDLVQKEIRRLNEKFMHAWIYDQESIKAMYLKQQLFLYRHLVPNIIILPEIEKSGDGKALAEKIARILQQIEHGLGLITSELLVLKDASDIGKRAVEAEDQIYLLQSIVKLRAKTS